MASEVVRGAVRLSANYTRQLISLSLSVLLTAILVAWIGNEGLGLIVLVTATVGIAGMADDLIRASLIRELAHRYHSGDERAFRDVYNSAWVIAAAGALVCAGAFAAAYFALPLLEMGDTPEERRKLLNAARWMLIADGVGLCAFVVLSPALNMYIVQERFIADNLWTLARKVVQPAAALIVWKGMGISDIGEGATAYVALYNAGYLVLLLSAAAAIVGSDRRFLPAPWRGTRAAYREILGTIGWNSLVNVVVNLYERVPAFIMFIFFGLTGTGLFGLAMQLASYVRMLTVGMNFGLDAVAARVSHKGGTEGAINLAKLTRVYTMMHALAALPGAVFIGAMAGPIVALWVGSDLEPGLVPVAATMVAILVLPVFARSMSDCWIRIAYGAGFIRRLAKLVVIGGIVHPFVSLALCYALPEEFAFHGPAMGYLLVFTAFHLLLLPMTVAGVLGGTSRDTISPMLRPLAAAAACAPILIAGRLWLPRIGIVELLALGTVFSAAYLTLTWFVVLAKPERERLVAGVRMRLGLIPRRAVLEPAAGMTDITSTVPNHSGSASK